MWVARCPRCGFAVRWSPRRARAPFRTWARLRALNTRLGIALGGAQAAGVLAIALGVMLVEQRDTLSNFGTVPAGRRWAFATGVTLLATACATLGAVSTVAFGPHVGRLARLACTWLLGALPVIVAGVLVGVLTEPRRAVDDILASLQPWAAPRIVAICGATVLASALLSAAAIPLHAWIVRRLAARQRRLHRFLRKGHGAA